MEPVWNDGHRFEGRVVLVTGAGGALGGATARAFGREGAKVVVAYRSSKESAEAAVSEIQADGGEAFVHQLEVTDPLSVEACVEDAVERYGKIDVLVNSAGRIDAADAVRFSEIDPAAWRALFDVDVFGTYLMCRAVAPHMLRSGRGAIVNFSGSYGNGVDQDNMVNSVAVQYCAAKGAVRGFTASLARDLAPSIRVNAIAPGPIAANWEEDWDIPKEHMEEAIRMTPLKRLGRPEEIAETVLFLASDGGGYVTGQIIQVDGGWILTG
jgi:NAD(P)-dependent dehydrogenase (short-subunit alcohol dehydrogenase family)